MGSLRLSNQLPKLVSQTVNDQDYLVSHKVGKPVVSKSINQSVINPRPSFTKVSQSPNQTENRFTQSENHSGIQSESSTNIDQ